VQRVARAHDVMHANAASPRAVPRGGRARAINGLRTAVSYTLRWMVRDAGWRVLTALGAINAGVHALLEAPARASTATVTRFAMDTLGTHARLFLILLATIYAGELVWREREERSAPLFDVLPSGTGVMLVGRVLAVLLAQAVVMLVLGVAVAVPTMLVAGVPIDVAAFAATLCMGVALPFAGWFSVALLVHVLVQQKVVGHLLVIAGWVVAVLVSGGGLATSDVGVPGAVWVGLLLLTLAVSRLSWVRGVSRESIGRGRLVWRGTNAS
jgi:ABC-2 type transport system permease protein